MDIQPYQHKVQYYETDQMKIVHHSNYIRWFEECRTDFFEQIDLPYDEMEHLGILSPVLEVEAKYLRRMRYGDTAIVELTIEEYNGIKLIFSYKVFDEKKHILHAKGRSAHCFLTPLGKPVSFKRSYPQYHERILSLMDKNEEEKETEEAVLEDKPEGDLENSTQDKQESSEDRQEQTSQKSESISIL